MWNNIRLPIITIILFIMLVPFNTAKANTDTYTVKQGDTLWKIATAYQMTVEQLKQTNDLKTDNIFIGQRLEIQTTGSNNQKKPVLPIAEQQFITITQAGKKVRVPLPQAPESNVPENIPGDKLSSITQKRLTAVVDLASSLQGTPYLWSGVTTSGFDCSGFIYYVFNGSGIDIPRMDTLSMYGHSYYVDEPIPGDLLFFENTYRSGISHAGIYIGDGKFIHAGSKQVEISSINYAYWEDKFVGYKRFHQVND